MRRGQVIFALLLIALSPVSSRAQVPPAGSAGAGNAPISGIPPGPANNPAVYDPSGIGNAARMPALPRQATIPTTPASPGYGNTAVVPRSALRSPRVRTLRRAEVRAPRSARSKRTREPVIIRDKRIDGRYSICRGC